MRGKIPLYGNRRGGLYGASLFFSVCIFLGPVVELADTGDLKSSASIGASGFESRQGYSTKGETMPSHGIPSSEIRIAHKKAHGLLPKDPNWSNPRWDFPPLAKDSWGIDTRPFEELLEQAYHKGRRDGSMRG
jgi:hypothetical protein